MRHHHGRPCPLHAFHALSRGAAAAPRSLYEDDFADASPKLASRVLGHSAWAQCVKVTITWRKPAVADGAVTFYGDYVTTDLRGQRACALFPCVDVTNAWSTFELQVRAGMRMPPLGI